MARLPREGDRYRARDNATIRLLAMHGEAGMSFSDAELPRGEIIVIDEDVEKPDRVFAIPDRYDELEKALVPAGDLEMPWYGGYMLILRLEQLSTDFERVD